jgi:hypothetical protein
MTQEELSKLTDEELLVKAKKMKSSSIYYALAIGFMFGIIIYSFAKNTYGFLTLIPAYFIYRMLKGSKNNDPLKQVLKERGLA